MDDWWGRSTLDAIHFFLKERKDAIYGNTKQRHGSRRLLWTVVIQILMKLGKEYTSLDQSEHAWFTLQVIYI